MSSHYGLINKLKDAATYEVQHPHLENIQLTVYRDTVTKAVLGVPTHFYGNTFRVHDNGDTIHQEHAVNLTAKEAAEYIESLCRTVTKQEFFYVRTLKEKGVAVGDEIQFEDGKRAVIVPLSEVDSPLIRSVFYVPLKKDGTPSKVKPRILYGNMAFEKEKKPIGK